MPWNGALGLSRRLYATTPIQLSAFTEGWIAVSAASSILFVGVGYTNTFGVFQNHYQTVLFPDEPPQKLIVIGSVAASLYFILGAFTGRLADVVGYSWNLLLGSMLMIASMFAASRSRTYWQLFLSQGLMFGLGVAFVYPPVTSVSRHYFGPKRHGLTNGIVVSGGALGGFILPPCVREMVRSLGLTQTFQILGYLAIGVLLPAAGALVFLERNRKKVTNTGKIFDTRLLSDNRFSTLILACTVAMFGFLPRSFLVPASAVSKGIDPVYASWLLGMMNGLSIIGRIGIGLFADRFGPLHALSVSFICCAIGHFAFWVPGVAAANQGPTSTALFTLFVIFVGILGSGFISLFPVVVAHFFGKEALASKTGLLNSFVGLSTLAGPSAMLAIVGEGHTRTPWIVGTLVAGLFMFVGGCILLLATMTVFKSGRAPPEGSGSAEAHPVASVQQVFTSGRGF